MEVYTVYVLYSRKYDKIYVGHTSNLISRFHSHNELSHKGWTAKFRPWLVIYCEWFKSKSDAIKREKQLKSSKGREFVRSKIIN